MNGNKRTMANRIECSTRKSLCFKSVYQFYPFINIPTNSIDDYYADLDSDIDNELINFVYPDEEEYWDEDWED